MSDADANVSIVTTRGLDFTVTRRAPRSASGSGSQVAVLLHGFPETATAWSAVSGLLADAGIASVAPDQRGYSPGARPGSISDYRLPELVADVVGLCDALDLPEVHLVGHDWGAIVAWAVAAAHPERLHTLTAVSVPHPAAFAWARDNDPDQRERSGYMEYFATPDEPEKAFLNDDCLALRLGYGEAVPAASVERHLAVLSEPGALTAALNWYRAMPLDTHDIGDVAVPTTFIWSTDDIAITRAGPERCAKHVSGPYQYVEVTGGTHWVPEEFPQVVADAIIAQIRETGSGFLS